MDFDKNIEKFRLIIRNFDESMCGKANKQNIKDLEDKIIELVPLATLDTFKTKYQGDLE